MLLRFLLVLCFFSAVYSFSQTGPGGVGNSTNNAFWIKADAGTSSTTNGTPINQWQDVSGNANHVSQTTAAQQPLYATSVMNGYPAIQFDFNNTAGQNDFLSGVDAANLDNTNGLTIFTVIRPTNLGSARSIIAKRTNVGVNQAYMFFFFTSDYAYLDIASNDDRFSTNPTAYAAGTNYIFNMHYDGTLAAASRAKIYLGQTLVVTSTETAATIPDYNSPLLVGTTHIGDNRAFGGYIAEIIIYREALGTAKRILVDNYLSAKYNIALASNNVYDMDAAGNGNFDHDVAGIGRESATDQSNDGQGSGIVRMLNPNGLDNNEYLMWGHNNGILQAINSTDIPAGVDARFDRVWRASESSKAGAAVDVGAIDIRWNLTGLGPVTASDLRLLVDTDNDGVFADETPISGATSLGGGVYQFAGVTAIVNQRRFTLATINSNQTPLPVELVNFNADVFQKEWVKLTWETKSELNSDYFVVERSPDGVEWTAIDQKKAAGNSSSNLLYATYDKQPYAGSNYYRLVQVDLDGTQSLSAVRFLFFAGAELTLFPNPANGEITLSGIAKDCDYLIVRNSLGEKVEEVSYVFDPQAERATVDISGLAQGVYFIETNLGSLRFIKL